MSPNTPFGSECTMFTARRAARRGAVPRVAFAGRSHRLDSGHLRLLSAGPSPLTSARSLPTLSSSFLIQKMKVILLPRPHRKDRREGQTKSFRWQPTVRNMKSVLFSRFFILLPWILIVIIMLDVDTRRPTPPLTPRPYFAPYSGGRGGARLPLRRGGPGRGREPRNESWPRPPPPPPEPPLPTIYAITPTYSRPVQKAELTRLANTFRQVAQLHWILVEDAAARSELVSRFLARAGLPSTHLHVPTPRRYKRPGLPRATEQRNAGLAWLRQRHGHQRAQPGVLFFADDDNTYSLELFQEMRTTRKVSVWPVGLVGGRRYERPLVENGKVVGWYTGWRADRPFAIDMAGFAVSLQVILSNPKAVFKRRGSQPGMQESDFLRQITTVEELEPKANNCTKVLVWHTRTEKVNLANEPKYHLDTVTIEV